MIVMFNEQLAGAAMIKGGGPCALRGWCFWPGDHQYNTEALQYLPIYMLGGDLDDIVLVREIHTAEKWFQSKGAENVYAEYEETGGHEYPNEWPQFADENGNNYDLAGIYMEFLFQDEEFKLPSNPNFNSNGQFY